MSLINREVLYEKACDLEAQALSYVGKIANDNTKIEEWRIWSAILAERTAFKHDIFDAPEVKSEPHWIPCSDRLPEEDDYKSCIECLDGAVWYFTENGTMGLGYYYKSTKEWSTTDDLKTDGKVIAWMPLPLQEPYLEEGENQ